MSTSEQPKPPALRIFISYSQHDPAVHSCRVREFAQALTDDGMDVELDQYHQHELTHWPRWCEEQLRPENSDLVLMVCSAEYKRRIENRVAFDEGRGVFWEGALIYHYLYEAKDNKRFISILFDDESQESLPMVVSGWTWFRVRGFGIATGEVGYTNLYRLLTAQPGVVKPVPGELKVLPPDMPLRQPPAVSTTKPTNLPYPSLGTLFKGREDFIDGIRAGFAGNPGHAQAIGARQAVHGLGGIGKTRAAVEYAWRFVADYTALLFVTAETPLDFRTNVAGLCPILKIAEGVTDDTVRFDAAIDWLREPRHHGWLFIVDNLDTPEAADEAGKSLATLEGGHVLITGRLSEWPAFVESRRLDVLDPDAATEFLLARTADKRQPHENDVAGARALAEELDGLALALEQAAAFIRRHVSSFAEYLQRWRAADQRVRQWHDARTMQYERPLAATWQTSIDMLSPAARSLLQLISWLAPEPLPRFLFDYNAAPRELRQLFEGRMSPREILRVFSGDAQAEPETALAALRDFSLLQPAKEVSFETDGQLHRVVALITRERQSAEEQSVSLRAALAMVSAATVGDAHEVSSWAVRDPLRPHTRTLVDFADERGIEEMTARLMNGLAVLFKIKAQHAEAEPLYRRAMSINEKAFGPQHPTVAIDLNNLAQLLTATNRFDESERLLHRALAINEESFGPDHPEVATNLNNLAVLFQTTNRLQEAEPLMRRVGAIFEKAFGPEHPNVATAFNNLAQLLQLTNRLEEAERLMRRVLAIDEKAFGREHPAVAGKLNNLTALLQATDRLPEAEPLVSRVVEIFEKAFGPEHPNVATALSNRAQLLQATNRLDEAEPLMHRVLAIDEKSFGPDHPEVAVDLNNLAVLLKDTNRPGEAERLMRRALEIDEKSFGPKHPHVAIRLNNLAKLLQAMHRLAEADPLMRRSVVIFLSFTRATGHLHPHLRTAFENYHGLLGEMNVPVQTIAERLAGLGEEAGLGATGFAELRARLEAD